jgi:rsbT antagonist protein RsbS
LSEGDTRVVLQAVGGHILVPLQGPVGEALLNDLEEALLDHLHRHGARGVVLDLAGVDVLDQHDFDRLRRIVSSATLMGAKVVLAGVRPSVAAGITSLEADGRWARATRTVEQAMALLR